MLPIILQFGHVAYQRRMSRLRDARIKNNNNRISAKKMELTYLNNNNSGNTSDANANKITVIIENQHNILITEKTKEKMDENGSDVSATTVPIVTRTHLIPLEEIKFSELLGEQNL